MGKLSINTIQSKLVEAHEYKKVSYEKMEKNGRLRAVGALNDPSTKITQIKQVTMPKDYQPTDTKGKGPSLFPEADFAGKYVDKMDVGIFEDNDSSGKPSSPPKVERMTPNQKAKQEKVSTNMQKGNRKSENSGMAVVPRTASMAGDYVDSMPRGIFTDHEADGTRPGGPKVAAAKNLNGTTRPKSSQKTANMTRHPTEKATGPKAPTDTWPVPSDAPKRKTVEKLKSGVLVRVNESVKAKFDIVSEKVLHRMVENYERYGYKTTIERNTEAPRWKTDRAFLQLLHETVAAKENQSDAFYKKLQNATVNHLYRLCQNDYNNLYESRDEFLNTIRSAFRKIEESAIVEYRKNLNLYVGKARIFSEGSLKDVELLSEALNEQMALRLIRNKLMENFGLNVDIRHIFIDGNKYNPHDIKEWLPRIKGLKL